MPTDEASFHSIEERFRDHSHRMNNIAQSVALLTHSTEQDHKDVERHERLLYGNGGQGLTTRCHQMESAIERLIESNRRRKANTYALYLVIVGQIVALIAIFVK